MLGDCRYVVEQSRCMRVCLDSTVITLLAGEESLVFGGLTFIWSRKVVLVVRAQHVMCGLGAYCETKSCSRQKSGI